MCRVCFLGFLSGQVGRPSGLFGQFVPEVVFCESDQSLTSFDSLSNKFVVIYLVSFRELLVYFKLVLLVDIDVG